MQGSFRDVNCALLLLLSAFSAAERSWLEGSEKSPAPRIIAVDEGGWGEARVEDLRAVLESAARELGETMSGWSWPSLRVRHSRRGPLTLFEKNSAGETVVLLNVEGRRWAQAAFQFAHELGHILCRFDDRRHPNEWFEEAVCEAAALFTLRRMARSWAEKPPFPHWKDYAAALGDYAEERIAGFRLPEGKSIAEWRREHEAPLRKDPHLESSGVVAALLLPLLEKEPSRWGAWAHLNDAPTGAAETLEEFLDAWRRRLPESEQGFADAVREAVGIRPGR